jgi:hypothetical protein
MDVKEINLSDWDIYWLKVLTNPCKAKNWTAVPQITLFKKTKNDNPEEKLGCLRSSGDNALEFEQHSIP